MDEILHHLGWLKPYKWWDNHYHPWWCRILSINSITCFLDKTITVITKASAHHACVLIPVSWALSAASGVPRCHRWFTEQKLRARPRGSKPVPVQYVALPDLPAKWFFVDFQWYRFGFGMFLFAFGFRLEDVVFLEFWWLFLRGGGWVVSNFPNKFSFRFLTPVREADSWVVSKFPKIYFSTPEKRW